MLLPCLVWHVLFLKPGTATATYPTPAEPGLAVLFQTIQFGGRSTVVLYFWDVFFFFLKLQLFCLDFYFRTLNNLLCTSILKARKENSKKKVKKETTKCTKNLKYANTPWCFFCFKFLQLKLVLFFGILNNKRAATKKNIYQEHEEEAAYAKATGIWTQSLKGRFHRICCGLASKQDCFVTGLNKRVNWIQFLFLLTINISRFEKSQERKKYNNHNKNSNEF